MATVGRGVLAPPVFEFFEGVRSFDAARAARVLAPDADFASPWNEGTITGREPIQAFLAGFLGDPKTRPSFSIMDIAGDGTIVHLKLSISGRFGRKPEHVTMSVLCLKGVVHQVVVRPVGARAH